MALRLLLTAFAGLTAHRSKPLLETHLGRGWLELACYTLGAIAVLPFFLWIHRKEGNPLTAYLLAFLSFGGGVGLGYFFDTINSK